MRSHLFFDWKNRLWESGNTRWLYYSRDTLRYISSWCLLISMAVIINCTMRLSNDIHSRKNLRSTVQWKDMWWPPSVGDSLNILKQAKATAAEESQPLILPLLTAQRPGGAAQELPEDPHRNGSWGSISMAWLDKMHEQPKVWEMSDLLAAGVEGGKGNGAVSSSGHRGEAAPRRGGTRQPGGKTSNE